MRGLTCASILVHYITKTCLYNVDPLKPHFYIVKLGFTGVDIIFLIPAQNKDCGYSLEPPRRGGSKSNHNLCFEQKYEKNIFFYLKVQFSVVKFSVYLNRLVLVMMRSFGMYPDLPGIPKRIIIFHYENTPIHIW